MQLSEADKLLLNAAMQSLVERMQSLSQRLNTAAQAQGDTPLGQGDIPPKGNGEVTTNRSTAQ